jgi:hypothetical protein
MAETFAFNKLERPPEAAASETAVENASNVVSMDSAIAMGSSNQRRKYPRREFLRKIGVLHIGEYSIADGVQIGEGGLTFESSIQIQEGDVIVLSFQVPGSLFIAVTAEALSSEKQKSNLYRTSCSFKNIQFENKRMIRTFVSART